MSDQSTLESKSLTKKENMENEPILDEKNFRFTTFPIKYNGIWELYQKQLACFWKSQEIDFSRDYDDYCSLNKDEQHFIKMVLAFFAASDGIVNFNISERFVKDVKILEAIYCYNFQSMMENIHAETYSLMLDNIIKDKDQKDYLFNSMKNIPSIKMMTDWAFKWIESSKSFHYRVIAFDVIEGIFFAGAFCSIFWLKKFKGSGKQFMNGLVKSNEFIARDESMHTLFACELYGLLNNKLSFNEVKLIVDEGVNISKNFIIESLPCKLIGMDNNKMSEYIEYVADILLVNLGYNKHYNKKNPFDFMNSIGMVQKTNFFESRPTEYQNAYTFNKNTNIEISDDF